jgi:hypothetical protein
MRQTLFKNFNITACSCQSSNPRPTPSHKHSWVIKPYFYKDMLRLVEFKLKFYKFEINKQDKCFIIVRCILTTE